MCRLYGLPPEVGELAVTMVKVICDVMAARGNPAPSAMEIHGLMKAVHAWLCRAEADAEAELETNPGYYWDDDSRRDYIMTSALTECTSVDRDDIRGLPCNTCDVPKEPYPIDFGAPHSVEDIAAALRDFVAVGNDLAAHWRGVHDQNRGSAP